MRLITLADGGREVVSALGFVQQLRAQPVRQLRQRRVSATVALMALERTGVHCSGASFDPRAA